MDIDINLVLHARDYIDDLAKGINPLTKEEIKDDDILNNVKIARCLFYVSDILDEVIKNGGIVNGKRSALNDFDLEKVEFDKYEFIPTSITISEIVNQINKLKPENMKKLKVTAVTNWLVDVGVLSVNQVGEKKYKRPTAEALNIGITEEQRVGQYGTYYTILYNESAQHFIIDNLHAVIEGGYNNRKKKE